MKSRIVIAAVAAMCAGLCEATALKVLMIGNSFSESALRQTPAVAKAMGCELDIANLMIGGCPLEKHWANVEKAEDGKFRPYSLQMSWTSCDKKESAVHKASVRGGINIPQALKAEKWDVVTIQQASGKSPFYKTYQPYADNLIAKIRELAPQAEIRIQETWSYAPYDGRLGVWKLDPAGMYEKLHEAYGTLAKAHNLKVIPTGTAVQEYRRALPVKYEKIYTWDELKKFEDPRVPEFYGDVCGKAYWGKGPAWKKDKDEYKMRMDPSHFNADGQYLQGCVWVAALFGVDVTKCGYRPDNLPEARAAVMRAAAMAAVAGRAVGLNAKGK